MTISKLTNTVKPLDEVDKINEIIDGLDNIDALPSQTGNAGKYLQTDGTDASWANAPQRNIGEIVASTLPLTDAGLHLLDGTLISGDGIYADFVDYIADLYGDGTNVPSYFETEANWQSSVTTYGVCGKFVYTAASGNNPATVRLPKITGILEGTVDVNALGNLIQAGLPIHTHTRGDMNITGTLPANGWTAGTTNLTGAFYKASTSTYSVSTGTSNQFGTGFDASRDWTGSTSNPNYSGNIQNSSTVQPQTIKAFYYIVVATSIKTDIEINLNNYANELNGKVNKSGDTMTGALTVSSSVNTTGGINLIANGATKGTNPSSTAYWGIRANDNTNSSTWSNTRLGVMEWSLATDGKVQAIIGTYQNTASSTNQATIKLACDVNGNKTFEFPKCTTKATTTSSASNNNVAVIVTNYLNGNSWYRVWSDGWIEQGGYTDTATVNLLKYFSNTNYTVTVAKVSANTGEHSTAYVRSKSTTQITFGRAWSGGDDSSHPNCNWYACGY